MNHRRLVELTKLAYAQAENIGGPLRSLAVFARAVEAWFHAAHHAVSGVSFAADHASLYDDIYKKAGAEFDGLIERAIGLTGVRALAEPSSILSEAAQTVSQWPAPTGAPDVIAKAAVQVNGDFIQQVVQVADSLTESGMTTRGTDNMLAQMADDHEVFGYKLGARAA